MIGLLQRVSSASVDVDGRRVAAIGRGLLVLVGVQRGDSLANGERLLGRLLGYRVFEDSDGRMNLSLRSIGPDSAGLLLVPQFTLAADTRSGSRASFDRAAAPEDAKKLFNALVSGAAAVWPGMQSGVFAADMQVTLVNDGPVTFWLEG